MKALIVKTIAAPLQLLCDITPQRKVLPTTYLKGLCCKEKVRLFIRAVSHLPEDFFEGLIDTPNTISLKVLKFLAGDIKTPPVWNAGSPPRTPKRPSCFTTIPNLGALFSYFEQSRISPIARQGRCHAVSAAMALNNPLRTHFLGFAGTTKHNHTTWVVHSWVVDFYGMLIEPTPTMRDIYIGQPVEEKDKVFDLLSALITYKETVELYREYKRWGIG